MLAIRLRRQGKTHFATYRIVVQEAQKQPTSGKIVAFVGAYNPHSKEVSVDRDLAQKYLDNGAQPTPRVAKLLRDNGVKLPSWVREFSAAGAKKTRNPEKLRKNAAQVSENSDNSSEGSQPEAAKAEPAVAKDAAETATNEAETAKDETAPAEPVADDSAETPAAAPETTEKPAE